MKNNNEAIKADIENIQEELKIALDGLIKEMGSKLKPSELEEINTEFSEAQEILERIKSGLIWIALFGKTTVGKSAVTNSLIGYNVAKVGVEHDLTTTPAPFRKDPWMIVDVPGFMGDKVNEDVAIQEASKALGHIFVIDGEPYSAEIELFDLVSDKLPNIPRIVFVNKWDVAQFSYSNDDLEKLKRAIEYKVRPYIHSNDDIVYGSALIKNIENGEMERQEIPQLLDRMYESAGLLGTIVNILDPAERAESLSVSVKQKIITLRENVARKFIIAFAAGSVTTTVIPFSALVSAPAILTGMVLAISNIMGAPITKERAKSITIELLKASAGVLVADFAFDTTVAVAGTMLAATGIGALFAFVVAIAAQSTIAFYAYRRTCILGEVALQYTKNDFSWGGESKEVVIKRCKERAMKYYPKIKK